MIRIILGIVIGAGLVYFMMGGNTASVTETVKSSVHSVASDVATATEPSTQDRIGDFLDNLTGK